MLNYIDHPSDASGTPLLIAHGLFGSGRNWGVIAKRLSDQRRVIAVDMRNHGQSPREKSNSYTDMAADLAKVIGHIGGPMDVLGHSMGGKAAMTLALTQPDLVRRHPPVGCGRATGRFGGRTCLAVVLYPVAGCGGQALAA